MGQFWVDFCSTTFLKLNYFSGQISRWTFLIKLLKTFTNALLGTNTELKEGKQQNNKIGNEKWMEGKLKEIEEESINKSWKMYQKINGQKEKSRAWKQKLELNSKLKNMC